MTTPTEQKAPEAMEIFVPKLGNTAPEGTQWANLDKNDWEHFEYPDFNEFEVQNFIVAHPIK